MNQYAATATFFGRLVGLGVTDVFVSPGLRSVPLSLTAHAARGLRLRTFHDERVAGFAAVGAAAATGRPVVVVCTSGSAVANLFPSVVEARQARVPLIVVTGDRPAELHGWESPQTMPQDDIFGAFAATISMPVGEDAGRDEAMSAAVAAWESATGVPAGPIHVNWPFREPLEPTGPIDVAPIGDPLPTSGFPRRVDPDVVADLGGTRRGLIAVGALTASQRAAVLAISRSMGWPIIADPLSGLRTPDRPAEVITTADHLLGHRRWADDHAPDLVLRVGSPPTSKSLRLWMERTRPKAVVVVDPAGRRRDPSRTMTRLVTATAADVAAALEPTAPASGSGWSDEWSAAERVAGAIIAEVADGGFEEAAATRATAAALDDATTWHVASSTPIRDVDWFVTETAAVVTANRGANGIDGTVSTALGRAIGSGARTVVTLGDVALLHDAGGLIAAGAAEHAPTVIVYDNGGGGIFSLLPIADAAEPDAFRSVLHTPTRLDLPSLAAAAGYGYERTTTVAELRSGLARDAEPRPWLLHVPVTIAGSRGQLETIRARVAARL